MLKTMFNSIRGIVSAKAGDALFVLSGDIEWDIAMPVNDIQGFTLNGECRVFTWLYHREDQMKLFGFASERRRSAFLELLKVEGIGPKGAIKILSGISQGDLEKALENGDVARLEAVPGLGKKTAQKMVLALKGKLVQTREISVSPSPYNDLVEALAQMGYDRRAAAEALAKAESSVGRNMPDAEREKLVFQSAIVLLSGA
ncbi:MAG: Holliday junction branch migration protein RuvA [Treponema sp.]|jgi:Holliday junction DNA helicase RuvA|nr:Holliday junction branch migration protein RuvA [Treponema sp.]